MSFWQSKDWRTILLESNQATEVFDIDGILIEKRSLGWGFFGLFCLGVSPSKKIPEAKFLELCKREKCLFIQIETFSQHDITPANIYFFEKGYYKKFITPYTAMIDLSLPEEEILAQMKPKGRYNILLAQKKGVTVCEVEKTKENIEIFSQLMKETTSRDGFFGNTLQYYTIFLENIPESSLIFTQFGEKIISAGIFVFQKEMSIYYYGASTSQKEYRNLMAPYLMQWYAIKKAKEIGSASYDFLGIAPPGDALSPLVGVTDFKLKFTPHIVHCSESYIWVPSKILYSLFTFGKQIKSRFR